jgi:hypothetical protein
MGFNFNNDHLPHGWIDDMMKNNGVRYMYSNSRKVDADTSFIPYVDSILYEKGNYKVIKLKNRD